MKFSANLGFLWNDMPLLDAIRAAKTAGFDAVECHWPYDYPAKAVSSALAETGLKMLGLNTRRGDIASGENGLSALPNRQKEAGLAIDEALSYAIEVGAANIHVMAGYAQGKLAEETFIANLLYACEKAAPYHINILIEPLNKYDAAGYFLTTTDQAIEIIKTIERPNLKLMFDCYHVQLMEGDLTNRLKRLQPFIGHIQFASVPDRGAPDHGEVNYMHLFTEIAKLGFSFPLGAEYKPKGATEQSLGWMKAMRAIH